MPLIPGLTFNKNIGREHFGRKHEFNVMQGVISLKDRDDPERRYPSLYARKCAPDQPAWIVYNKMILQFDAYFQQTHCEMRDVPQIIRPVKIFFFLEDGTVKIFEPEIDNAGVTSGVFLSRQRVKLPNDPGMFYEATDFNVGKEVEIYGRVFMIISCDNHTRTFLNRLGIRVPDPLNLPKVKSDFYSRFPHKSLKPIKKFPFSQFLENDRKVLRFNGYWDNKESEFGLFYKLRIHYYLADDTIEVYKEKQSDGFSDETPILLKRSKIPKYTPRKLDFSDADPVETYGVTDLVIGATINLYGREIVLIDCDGFTREYYREVYGLNDFTPMTVPDIRSMCKEIVEHELPPWNGYGSFEDSAGNCKTVEPKSPHRDFIKFLHKDRVGMDSHILRFAARMISDDPNNDRRLFIINYYLCDDTIGVFELAERNSGFTGGRFIKRDVLYLPGVKFYVPKEPPTYTAQDMWIGNIIVANQFRFRLFCADEYALRYMELHPEEYPKANAGLIMDKIRRVIAKAGLKEFVTKYQTAVIPGKEHLMPLQCFKQAIRELLCDHLTEHEFVTVVRFFRGDFEGSEYEKRSDREEIRSQVMSACVRDIWDDREAMLLMFKRYDDKGLGYLSRHCLRQGLRAVRLPISETLMDSMLNLLIKNNECEIKYTDVIDFLNFKTCTEMVKALKDENCVRHSVPYREEETFTWDEEDKIIKCGYVNWNAFLCQLNLEKMLDEKETKRKNIQ